MHPQGLPLSSFCHSCVATTSGLRCRMLLDSAPLLPSQGHYASHGLMQIRTAAKSHKGMGFGCCGCTAGASSRPQQTCADCRSSQCRDLPAALLSVDWQPVSIAETVFNVPTPFSVLRMGPESPQRILTHASRAPTGEASEAPSRSTGLVHLPGLRKARRRCVLLASSSGRSTSS